MSFPQAELSCGQGRKPPIFSKASKPLAFSPDDDEIAQEICLDALDEMNELKLDEQSGLAAFLTTAMHATYAMAPSEEVADEMIALARNMAEQNWAEEQKKRGTA